MERFQRRRQATVHTFDPGQDYSNIEFVSTQQIRRDFWQAVNFTGPAGAAFRSENSYQALQLAERLISSPSFLHEAVERLNFLFLDVQGRQPLARDFWPEFKDKITAFSAHHDGWTGLLVQYLARIRPLPPATEFIDVFPEAPLSPWQVDAWTRDLKPLPDALKLEIALGCIARSNSSPIPADSKRGKPIERRQIEERLRKYIATIPWDAANDLTFQDLKPSSSFSKFMARELERLGTSGMLTPTLLTRLSVSSDPEHRAWVIPQLRMLPHAAHRTVLGGLLKDPDQAVRAAAAEVAEELEELRRRALPTLE